METVVETTDHYLTSITMGPDGQLYALCTASGDLLQVNVENGALSCVCATETTPMGCAVGTQAASPSGASSTGSSGADQALEFFFTNHAEQSVMQAAGANTIPSLYLSRYGGKSFSGPTAIAVSPVDGEVFFTDSGADGDATLTSPAGAVYRTIEGRSQLVALAPHGLSQPSHLAVGRDGCVYVCEQAANRLLRYVPRGAYFIGGVFASLQGSMGPSAVAISPTDGSVFVCCYEDADVGAVYESGTKDGKVVVYSRDGTEQGAIVVPSSELRGVAVSLDGKHAYVLNASRQTGASTIYRVAV